MTQPPPDAPAGWYPDPDGGALRRYWDGSDWGPYEPQSSSAESEAGSETPEPVTVAQALREVKREVKKEWAKVEEEAEAAAEATTVKVNFWAAGILWLLITIGTWATDFSILAKIGITFVLFFVCIGFAVKGISDDEQKRQEKKRAR